MINFNLITFLAAVPKSSKKQKADEKSKPKAGSLTKKRKLTSQLYFQKCSIMSPSNYFLSICSEILKEANCR